MCVTTRSPTALCFIIVNVFFFFLVMLYRLKSSGPWEGKSIFGARSLFRDQRKRHFLDVRFVDYMIRNIATFLPQAFIWSSLASASVELTGTIDSCLMEFDLTAIVLYSSSPKTQLIDSISHKLC